MKIFFATDLHGSLLCFKKFLTTKHFYGADMLILGGDLTAKGIVPIVNHGTISNYTLYGKHFECRTPEEKEGARKLIENAGFYQIEVDENEAKKLEQPEELESRFQNRIRTQVETWDEAAVKLGVQICVVPGNDDPLFLDSFLTKSKSFINCDRKVIEINGWSVLGFGASNPTPWKTFREFEESEIEETIDGLMHQVKKIERCIWNVHVPPINSKLDVCESVDENFRVITSHGKPQMESVGSSAVDTLLRKWQPPVGLFGHVHESRAFTHIGKTLCVNPGSEYFLGTLNGCLIDVDDSGVKSFQLTSG